MYCEKGHYPTTLSQTFSACSITVSTAFFSKSGLTTDDTFTRLSEIIMRKKCTVKVLKKYGGHYIENGVFLER